ncbi:hypothetical protein K431DRAFT_290120 [Polychaeton citri CBS 116435]|uniref:C2H2-type domain-containing protein n=1 Tax=Polychaeton citri CBS 116435 TaxID=1314669 RepID=A0A9P4UV02_9PEZI|nr:hypothetical protein K431DRAFT_290120 [Polychaeton citri CBS 116435]
MIIIASTNTSLYLYSARHTTTINPASCYHTTNAKPSDKHPILVSTHNVQRHLKYVHNPEQQQRFECEMPGCKRVGSHPFTRRDKYTDHLREVHGMDIPKRQQGSRSP